MVNTTNNNSTKKRVPDWLNSSLWSSTPTISSPPQATEVLGQTIKSLTTTSKSSITKESPEVPPQMEPPVIIRAAEPTPKLDTRDPLTISASGYGNYYSNDEEYEVITPSEVFDAVVSSVKAAIPSPTPRVAPASEDISRKAQILQELSQKVVNLGELRRLSSQGIPDGGGIRATVWKLLLAYLPCDRSLWSTELAKKRSQYMNFKEEMLMNPSEITRRLEKSSLEHEILNSEDDGGYLSRSEVTHGEHPLSLGKTSVWNQFFQDTEIIEQIDRDVKRTHPDLNFFSGDTSFARSNQDALRNILIIFAKLNPGIRYVQGMNEILAPIYYVFKSDPNEENAGCAEGDSFFCFVEIMSGFRDNFCQQLDDSVVGIRSTISRLSQLLKEHDEELWRHLDITTKVNPQFYAFRWITLLLTQEFNFPDSLFIWDTLLSDPEGPQETLLRICCAMLIIIRKRLLAGDFTANLKLLQSYPPTNISHLLYVANKLRAHPVA